MNVVIFVIVVIFCRLCSFGLINYCKLNCPSNKHSACGTGCKRSNRIRKEIGPSYEFRYRMWKRHNELRNKVANGAIIANATGNDSMLASDMMILNYDMSLEFTAACWLYQTANTEPDKCGRTTNFLEVGQNFYKGDKADPRTMSGIDLVVEEWTRAKDKITKDMIEVFEGTEEMEVRQYIQMIWSNTYAIGCATALVGENNKTFYIIVCNYAPKHKPRHYIFFAGKTATKCPYGTDRNPIYTALCGNTSRWPAGAYTEGNPELNSQRLARSISGFTISWSIQVLMINLSLYSFI